ncbi:hypothetical protein GCM10009077_18610 [Roseibium denhamense]
MFRPFRPVLKERIKGRLFGYLTWKGEFGRINTAAPLGRQDIADGYAAIPESLSDLPGVLSARFIQVPLCATVAKREVVRITCARSQSMPEKDDAAIFQMFPGCLIGSCNIVRT